MTTKMSFINDVQFLERERKKCLYENFVTGGIKKYPFLNDVIYEWPLMWAARICTSECEFKFNNIVYVTESFERCSYWNNYHSINNAVIYVVINLIWRFVMSFDFVVLYANFRLTLTLGIILKNKKINFSSFNLS